MIVTAPVVVLELAVESVNCVELATPPPVNAATELITPLPSILILAPILTPPSVDELAVGKVYGVAVVALIVPSAVILIPEPILTPPSVLTVAVVSV